MNKYVNSAVDGLYTAAATYLGYALASGGAVIPSKAAIVVCLVTGLAGMANDLRGKA